MNKIISICAIMIIPFMAFGQWRSKEVTAKRIDKPVKIDGLLNEPVWEQAPEVTGFIQFQPDGGEPGSEKTVVKILYNDRYIYFGFYCYDSSRGKIAASTTKRDDRVQKDDSVLVLLDTFHDRRTCYYFVSNLLGTQLDGRISDNGRTNDVTWDGIWKSAGHETDFGWSAELALELSSLKYEPGENQTWGLSLGRRIPRRQEDSFWTGPIESPYKVSQFGVLTDMRLKKSKKKNQIIPHLISTAEEKKQTEMNAGLDVRYAFSQLVSGNITVNPDFATIEADQEQINLTRFELTLNEKRFFFLEGSEIYRQRIRLFYSRRISDIYGGATIYGKSGGYEFSGLSAQTKEDDETGEGTANFSVFRLKKDVMESSNFGFLMANKLIGGKNIGTAGFDTALYFTDTLKFTGQFALSYGDHNRDNIAFFLRPSYDSATFHIHLQYSQLGQYFGDNANAVGLILDDNRRELDSAIVKTFWLKKSAIEMIRYKSNYNIYWGLGGTLRSWQIDQILESDLKNKFGLDLEHHQEYKLYEKDFRNHKSVIELHYNTREWQSAKLSYSFGHNFDQDFQLLEGWFNYKITRDLSFQYELTRLFFDPDLDGESTWIHVIRATNYFTNDLFLKVFYQINSSIDKKNIQVLFVYRFQPPFGSFQLAYQKGTALFGVKGTQRNTLFVKLVYMF